MSDAWNRGRLGDVCRVIPGYAFKSSDWQSEGIPVVKIKNITGDTSVDLTEIDCVPESLLTQKLQKFVLSDGDILVAMTGATAGKVGKVRTERPVLLNQRVAKIAPVEADAGFIWSVVSSQEYQEKFFYLADGAAQPNMSGGQIEGVEIPLPPLPVQRRIAGILSAYDELIENSQRRIRILEAMARAIYREWFVHFRFPGHETHPRVASTLGDIPKGWEVKTVEEIVKRLPVGKKYDQKTVSPTGAVPVFDQGKSGIIGYHDDEPGVIASETAPVIVFANHTCYQRLVHIPFSAIQNVLPFVPSPALPRSIYWLHWATNGLVLFNDYKGHWPEFAAKSLVVPPAELCQRFGDFAAPLSRTILKLECQLQNLHRTRDLLLPRLLSGQVNLGES